MFLHWTLLNILHYLGMCFVQCRHGSNVHVALPIENCFLNFFSSISRLHLHLPPATTLPLQPMPGCTSRCTASPAFMLSGHSLFTAAVCWVQQGCQQTSAASLYISTELAFVVRMAWRSCHLPPHLPSLPAHTAGCWRGSQEQLGRRESHPISKWELGSKEMGY